MSITVIAAQAATTHASSLVLPVCPICAAAVPAASAIRQRSGACASQRASGGRRASRSSSANPTMPAANGPSRTAARMITIPPADTSARFPGPTRTEKLSVTKPPTARIPRTARRVGESGISEPVARTNPPMLRNQSAAVSAEMA